MDNKKLRNLTSKTSRTDSQKKIERSKAQRKYIKKISLQSDSKTHDPINHLGPDHNPLNETL